MPVDGEIFTHTQTKPRNYCRSSAIRAARSTRICCV